MAPAKPTPDEKNVRDALLRVLKRRGLEPKEDWVTVHIVHEQQRTYTFVIAREPARAALSDILRRYGTSMEDFLVGVWFLDESLAWQLCEGSAKPS